jgi:flagellar protein FlaG
VTEMKIQGVATGIEADPSRPVAVYPKNGEAKVEGSSSGESLQATPVAAAPVQPVEKSKEMERLSAEVQRYFKENQSKLDISLDKDLKMIVTKVLDAQNGEVIRQYPPESVIEVMKYLRSQRGMIVNEKG